MLTYRMDIFFQQVNTMASKPKKYATELAYIVDYIGILNIKTTCTGTHVLFDIKNVDKKRLETLCNFVDICFTNHQDPNKYKRHIKRLRDSINKVQTGATPSIWSTPINFEKTKLDSRRKLYVPEATKLMSTYKKKLLKPVRSYFTMAS